MNWKTTGWLVALTGALGAFVWFIEPHLPHSGGRDAGPRPLLADFHPPAVTSIEVIRSNLVLRADRTNGLWHLRLPAPQPARQLRLDQLLAAVDLLTRDAVLTDSEALSRPQAAAEFGLSPPLATVVLHQNGRRRELLVGSRTLGGDQVYLQLVGTPGIYFAPALLAEALPAGVNDWRDTALLPLKELAFNRVEVRSTPPHGFELQLNPTNQLWHLTKPAPARADLLRVGLLFQQLQSAEIARFVADTPGFDLEAAGLQPPVLELVLAQNTNTLLAVQFGRSPTNEPALVYARRPSLTNVVLVPREFLDQLRVSARDFLDRRLIAFNFADVDSIEVRGAESFTLRRQTNASWRVVAPTDFAADPDTVQEFLASLGELRIGEFEKDVVTDRDFAAYGLAPPRRQYTLTASQPLAVGFTNRPLAQIDFGSNTVEKVYARRADENSLYSVSPLQTQRLPTAAFQFRDRSLWAFAPTNVTSLTIMFHGQTRKILRGPSGEWTLAAAYKGQLNTLVIEPLLEALGQLKAEFWVAQGTELRTALGFPDAAHQVQIELGGEKPQTLVVDFGRFSAARRPYASAAIGGQPMIFEFPLRTYDLYEYLRRDLFLSVSAAPAP